MVVTEVFGVCMVHSAEEHIKLVEDQVKILRGRNLGCKPTVCFHTGLQFRM